MGIQRGLGYASVFRIFFFVEIVKNSSATRSDELVANVDAIVLKVNLYLSRQRPMNLLINF